MPQTDRQPLQSCISFPKLKDVNRGPGTMNGFPLRGIAVTLATSLLLRVLKVKRKDREGRGTLSHMLSILRWSLSIHRIERVCQRLEQYKISHNIGKEPDMHV